MNHKNLSGLLFWNYWWDFILTLKKWSVPNLVVHIVSIFQFNDFCQSYDPLMIFIFKVCLDYLSWIANAILMKLYRIDNWFKFSRISFVFFFIEWILDELWPLEKKCVFLFLFLAHLSKTQGELIVY